MIVRLILQNLLKLDKFVFGIFHELSMKDIGLKPDCVSKINKKVYSIRCVRKVSKNN